MKRVIGAAAVCAGLLMLAGCAQPPSYEQVRADTEKAMQAVVDQLPAGVEVEDLSRPPYDCDLGGGGLLSGGDGQFFTGHWAAYPDDIFDGQAYIDELPAGLGDGWEVDESAVEVSYPALSIKTKGVLLDISVVEGDDGETIVDILGISPCGAP